MKEVFLEHFARYPFMEPRDAVKLAYQSAFGAGHLLTDPAAARLALQEELVSSSILPNQPLLERIGGGHQRLYLTSSECKGISLDSLYFLFDCGAKGIPQDMQVLEKMLAILRALTAAGLAPFSGEALELFLGEYQGAGCPPVGHSPAYRAVYAPAYRVMDSSFLSFLPLLRAIDTLLAHQSSVTVAIDGMAAAGKSTLGELLVQRYGCNLIHMDDFFLPPALRTPERLAAPGGNVHYERFREEVLSGLAEQTPFRYGIFDCHTMSILMEKDVKPNSLTVVEGAYALHPSLRGAYDLKVFYPVAPEAQLERIRLRNGPGCVPAFRDKWIPLENAYFSACGVRECCDLTISSGA